MVRKDIKSTMIQQPQLAFYCTVLKIKGEATHFHIANTYTRDNQLNILNVQHLFDTWNNLVLAGNLNAKHQHILPHTRKTKYNSNGTQLHMFIDGLDGPFSILAEVTVHNLHFTKVWAHIRECGPHFQIDYIITNANIYHFFVDTTYKENLLSNHQGISVRAPFLFPEFHTLSAARFILDWSTCDSWNYNFITESKIDAAVVKSQWHKQTLTEKINFFTKIHKFTLDKAAMYKQVSNRGNTKPRLLINLIQCKHRLQNSLPLLALDTRIRTENANS